MLKSSLKRRSESLTEDQISPGKYWNFSNIIEYSTDYGEPELHSIAWDEKKNFLQLITQLTTTIMYFHQNKFHFWFSIKQSLNSSTIVIREILYLNSPSPFLNHYSHVAIILIL